jgi:hypothetical protein
MADERIQKSRTNKPNRRKDYDDEDDEDRPAPRRRSGKKKESGGSGMLWLLLALFGGGGLVFCACPALGAVVWFMMARRDRPPIAVRDLPPLDIQPPLIEKDKDRKKEVVQAIKAPGTGLAIDINQGTIRDITFAPNAQGVAVMFLDARGNNKDVVDYWEWKKDKRSARIELAKSGHGIDLSPQGTRFLSIGDFPKGLTVWSLPNGQQLFKDWDPYPPQKKFVPNAPDFMWANFIDENRLITFSRTGQFDIWDVNQRQLLATSPAQNQFFSLQQNFFARAPQNFALSHDRKKVAIANGDGYDLFDTATAKKTGKTASVAADGKVGNVWGTAFSADGTQLACKHNLFKGNQQEYLTIWDTATGARKGHFKMKQDFNLNGPLTWIGPRHVMLWDGNVFRGTIVNVTDGKHWRVCETAGPGNKFARTSPDGRIWYVAGQGFNAPCQLFAVDFPENDLAGAAPADPANLPRWFFGRNGITRDKQ